MIRTNNNRLLFFLIFLVITLSDAQFCHGKELCIGNNSTLDCLKDNFDNLYTTDYALFWHILRSAERDAINCKSRSDTAIFLKLAAVARTNAEFNEYFNEVIERLATSHPECFFDSLLLLDLDNVTKIIMILKHPIVVEKQEIDTFFSKNMNKEKYRVIMDIYFQK
jgi:hypothetical protein